MSVSFSGFRRLLRPVRCLLGGAAIAWLIPGAASAACQGASPAWMVERVLPADCAACWADAPAWTPPPGALLLDWVVPTGDDAPLQAVALPEARARWPGDAAAFTAHRVWPLAAQPGPGTPRLRVQDGPAWNGYIATALHVERPVGAGARQDWSAWAAHVALVEVLPAGDEGSGAARQLVRAVAGPLPLAALASQARLGHVQAMRVPQGGQPGRWKTVGWLTRQGEPRVAAWAEERRQRATDGRCRRPPG